MQITMIALGIVVPDSEQPRENFPQGHINALAKSIETRGLKNPIHVRPANGDGTHTIINGECRFKAITQLGWEEIPAIVMEEYQVDLESEDMSQHEAEIFMDQILDNVVRKDMDIMETIRAYQKALDMDVPVTNLAKAFGCSVSVIEKDLPLLNLPKTLQRDVNLKVISKEIARKLAELHEDGFNGSQIKSAWDYVKRASKFDGQKRRLEVWKTDQAGEASIVDETKDETSKKERAKYASQVSKFMTTFKSFSKKIQDNEKFLSGAMMHLTKRVNDGSFEKDLNYCIAVLDDIRTALTDFTAHKP